MRSKRGRSHKKESVLSKPGKPKRNRLALNIRKKERVKVIKTVSQSAILLVVGVMLYNAVFNVEKYVEPDRAAWTNQKGFIALSYFGVARNGTPKLVAKSQLDEQLKALYEQGYTTISQQDVLDYYQKGKALPEKALFLSFEDGRNDSSLFAQPLLEKYNYKATFLSYANKMGNSDQKFVQPKEMLKMSDTGFWELGTNGYRLTYINIFDKKGRFVGVRDENELTHKENVEYYNHYLMDFLRDDNMIPVEDKSEMRVRIDEDYKAMKDIYSDALGYVPSVYMIMHANALHEGMNRLVSDANSENIQDLFKMHFNREGQTYNTSQASLYDLTRVQPAPYWFTNHLLMKIQKDTGQRMEFVRGDAEYADRWTVVNGAAQFLENRIALTSPSAGAGMLYLKESDGQQDVKLTAKLAGNVVGKQSVYLRYDRQNGSFLRVTLEDNELIVEQKKPGQAAEPIFTRELSPVQWKSEDLAFEKATVYTKEQTLSGGPATDEQIPINIQQTRQLEISLQGDRLQVKIDAESLLSDRAIDSAIKSGGIALESKYSEQNKKDDIYDGVFDDVQVQSLGSGEGQPTLLFSNQQTGLQGVINKLKKQTNAVVDWMIDTF